MLTNYFVLAFSIFSSFILINSIAVVVMVCMATVVRRLGIPGRNVNGHPLRRVSVRC